MKKFIDIYTKWLPAIALAEGIILAILVWLTWGNPFWKSFWQIATLIVVCFLLLTYIVTVGIMFYVIRTQNNTKNEIKREEKK